MEFHPIADLFPLMSADEFEVLCLDIATNGLRESIWTYEGKIIDGRNRYNACREVEVEPQFRAWEGKAAGLVPFVVSLNLHRRHLNESQRAMIAARLATMRQGERTDLPSIDGKLSQTAAAQMLNVSESSVERARKVTERGVPELQELVEKGAVPVSRAATIARLSPLKQKKLIKQGRASGKKLVTKFRSEALKRIGRRGHAGCLCQSDASFDGPSIAAVMELFAVKASAYAREHGTQNFAGIFQGVVFDLAEDELSGIKGENAKKVLAIIDAGTIDSERGLREKSDLQRISKLSWSEFDDVMTYLVDYGLVDVLEQGGKTEAARGARKIIYRRTSKAWHEQIVIADDAGPDPDVDHADGPEDVYHDSFAENW